MIIIPIKCYLFGNIPYFQTNPYVCNVVKRIDCMGTWCNMMQPRNVNIAHEPLVSMHPQIIHEKNTTETHGKISERPNLPALSSAPKGSALVKWRKRLNASSYRFVWNILNMGDGHNFGHLNGEKWTMIINHQFFGGILFSNKPISKGSVSPMVLFGVESSTTMEDTASLGSLC